MTLPNIELYEALKRDISEDGARMIAEVVPPAGDLATKADIMNLEARVDGLGQDFLVRLGELEAKLLRYTLGFFLPLWIAVLATLVTLVLRA